MKIAVHDDLVPGRLQIAQPGDELSIFHRIALMMIIGDDEKRTDANSMARCLVDNLIGDLLRRRRYIMDGNDEKILTGAGRRDDR